MPLFERMVIAGVGLIGGSLGLVVRERALAGEVVGYGRSEENLATALARGAVDRYSRTPAEAAAGADLVVLAVPVLSIRAVAQRLLPHASPHAVVIDVGSVKAAVLSALEPLVRPPAAFVGCHPIAGTERSGAASAFLGLFEGRLCVLTPTATTDPGALGRVRALWQGVGMRVEEMPAPEHDRLLALVSHLPHAVAYALVSTIAGATVDGRNPLAYGGGGLRDTTRVAASDPEMWRDIFLENREQVLRAIDEFSAALAGVRASIENRDAARLVAELERSRRARRDLEGRGS